jgi:hypothetical protein
VLLAGPSGWFELIAFLPPDKAGLVRSLPAKRKSEARHRGI